MAVWPGVSGTRTTLSGRQVFLSLVNSAVRGRNVSCLQMGAGALLRFHTTPADPHPCKKRNARMGHCAGNISAIAFQSFVLGETDLLTICRQVDLFHFLNFRDHDCVRAGALEYGAAGADVFADEGHQLLALIGVGHFVGDGEI